MTQTTIDTLWRLKTQRNKLDARIQDCEARDKARACQQNLQRKILVGTYMLEQAHHEGRYADLVAKLDVYLTRDNDRQLFDLPARG